MERQVALEESAGGMVGAEVVGLLQVAQEELGIRLSFPPRKEIMVEQLQLRVALIRVRRGEAAHLLRVLLVVTRPVGMGATEQLLA